MLLFSSRGKTNWIRKCFCCADPLPQVLRLSRSPCCQPAGYLHNRNNKFDLRFPTEQQRRSKTVGSWLIAIALGRSCTYLTLILLALPLALHLAQTNICTIPNTNTSSGSSSNSNTSTSSNTIFNTNTGINTISNTSTLKNTSTISIHWH